jgi:hypothetical protein
MRGVEAVNRYSAKRSLSRRIVALFAAYAIALSGLLASFTAAHAAAAAAGTPGAIICHTLVTGEAPVPAGDQNNGDHCANCCVGCLMLMAALPPPPVTVTGAPQAAGRPLPPPAVALAAAGPVTKSHRSRAPPLTA